MRKISSFLYYSETSEYGHSQRCPVFAGYFFFELEQKNKSDTLEKWYCDKYVLVYLLIYEKFSNSDNAIDNFEKNDFLFSVLLFFSIIRIFANTCNVHI